MKKIHNILFLFFGLFYLTSCESDDYMNDGGKTQRFVDMTTYDFLKQHGKFDSLVKIIDRAGLKDVVNEQNTTFFACTDYSVAPYVSVKKQQRIIELGNENINFGINDISLSELDSLKMYLFDGAFIREYLTTEDKYFTSKLGNIDNVRFRIKLRRANNYSSWLDYVDYLNFTRVVGSLDSELPDGYIVLPNEEDLSYDCQTSDIITTTGVINVLSDTHRLMFNQGSLASN